MSRKRILVVEDSETVRRTITNALSEEYDMLEAPDGLKGWILASMEPQPDLVITDVEMPRLNGISLVKRLQSNESTKRIPIILLTARDRTVDVAHGMRVGVRMYLTKPFHPDDVLVKVKKLLEEAEN